jgi:undecaprenyl-diphosphatase
MSFSLWLERLREIDVASFYLINNTLRNEFFDSLMPFVTNKWNFAVPLGLLLLFVLLFRPKRDRILAVSAIAVVLLADATAYFLKDVFHRIRPCHVLQHVYLLRGAVCTNSYSFPSNHATNMFAIAAFFSYNYRTLVVPSYLAAVLVGYSRIYLGVHYPADVMAGLLFGTLLGFSAAIMAERLTRLGQVDDPVRAGQKEGRSATRPISSQ